MDSERKKFLRKVENSIKNPWKPMYIHIGYREGRRVVMYERLAGHPIDKVISAGLVRRKKHRFWHRILRSSHLNTIYIIGLFVPDFKSWWEKVRR